MPTDLENLRSIKSQLIAALADLTANPKPTYSVNGQSFSWSEHRAGLMQQLTEVNGLIQAESPYELKSQMF